MDIMPTLTLLGIVLAVAAAIWLMIYIFLVMKRKVTKKEVTQHGTDKSDFAKMLMDELHEERNKNLD